MEDRQSTLPEVKLLHGQLQPRPGELIPWAALEEILHPLTRQDRRFRTVYRAWIRYLRQWHNRKMVAVPGQGLRVLHERERSADVAHTLGRTWMLFDRAKTDVDEIQIVELTPPELDETHHVRLVTHTLYRVAAEQRERLAQGPRLPEPSSAGPTRVAG